MGEALTDPTPGDLDQMRNSCKVTPISANGFLDAFGKKMAQVSTLVAPASRRKVATLDVNVATPMSKLKKFE